MQFLVAAVVILGAAWIFSQPAFWAVAGSLLLLLVVLALWSGTRDKTAAAARQELEKTEIRERRANWEAQSAEATEVFWAVVEGHLDELGRARRQSIRKDRYGVEHMEGWRRELEYFMAHVVLPALSKFPSALIEDVVTKETNSLETRLIRRSALLDVPADICGDMSPTDYERHCAELLTRAGWDARTTKGSGDQGADVIATRGGKRLVLQCKLYSSPVGNTAVQEVVAAKIHEGAGFGAVVSNAAFTPAARQLAATTGTLLLHHSELTTIEKRLT